MWKTVALATLLGACGAQLADDPSQHAGNVDASTQNPGTDAAVIDPTGDAGNTTSPDAGSAALTRVVYLNFVGANLHKGTTSDATQNIVSWMYNATSGTAPAYGNGQANLDTIRDGVIARLAGIATVTVSRPQSGQYVMIVYGGVYQNVHSFYGTAVNTLDCGDVVKNDVAWISDSISPTAAIEATMGAIGFGLGLSATTNTTDCMCSWGNNCQRAAGACTLHEAIARDPNVASDPNTNTPDICPGTTQNELTTFKTAFSP